MFGVLTPQICRDTRRALWQIQKRFKTDRKRQTKKTNTDRAQEYFDVSYPPIYGPRWPSVRLALLSKQKYVALINNFANHDETLEKLEELGALNIYPIYKYHADRIKSRNKQLEESSGEATDASSTDDQQTIRPSLVELDDDEIAARQNQEPLSRYPEEYRQRIIAKGESVGSIDIDFTSRQVKPSESLGTTAGVMMDHVPATKLKGLENWIEETDVFHDATYGNAEIGLKMEVQQDPINLPETLKIYSFSKGDTSHFPQPKMDRDMGVLNYYCMDGASVLPVLALGIQPGQTVLDLCAAPGGKSLVALQTLLPNLVVSNDRTESRVNRIKEVMKQYIPKGLSSIENTSVTTIQDGLWINEKEAYDHVLVDAPCLTDRHSLHEDDNNIFKTSRVKERLRLPEIQSQLLVNALHKVRPGGNVVYSTCTLSPLQNDGVVHLALTKIWQETTIECSVVDLSVAVRPFSFLYRFGNNLGLRYGQIVLPSLLSNFGPMYFAKIKRLK